jgi:predicted peroxiredoxin
MANDDRVLIGLTHAEDDPESVLVAYLMGVEALRAGKDALLWLTKDGVAIATDGVIDKVSVPGAPAVTELHAEYVERGGRIHACPVCVKVRGLDDADLTAGAEVRGAPSVYEFTAGGALTFTY